jgi:perosamine synthetase
MSEVAAAIGLVQLSKLPEFLEARRKNAEVLTDKLKDLDVLQLPFEPQGRKHGWHVYTVRLKGATAGKRDRLVKRLRARGVEAVVYYPTPIHLMTCYSEYAPEKGSLPNTEIASKQVFSLPVHPAISREDLDYIANTLRKLL